MSSELALHPEPAPLEAVTVSRDVQEFDLLIEDMEAELGEGWGDLSFSEAMEFLRQDDAREMSFIVVALDHQDEDDTPRINAVIKQAKRVGLQVILVADGLSPMVLHELMRSGADDFVPYPLPEKALGEAIMRARSPKPSASPAMEEMAQEAGLGNPLAPVTGGSSEGSQVYAFQSIAGGAGASTVAVNTAWEIASGKSGRTVCLLDLGLQYGSVGTYMDLSPKSNIYEILTDTSSMDEQAFRQSLQTFEGLVHVFTAPSELLPLDLIGPDDVKALIALARKCFDVVIIDLPTTLTGWTDTVMDSCDRFFVLTTLEVRAAQNAMRLIKLLKSEAIPMDTMGWILNKAPGKSDLSARGRVEKMADTLEVRFEAVLPDGGKAVTDTNDQAVMMAQGMARTPIRREIAGLAERLSAVGGAQAMGAPKAKKPIFGIKFG